MNLKLELPLWYDELSGNIYDKNDEQISSTSYKQHAELLTHCANNFPALLETAEKMYELLKEITKIVDKKEYRSQPIETILNECKL